MTACSKPGTKACWPWKKRKWGRDGGGDGVCLECLGKMAIYSASMEDANKNCRVSFNDHAHSVVTDSDAVIQSVGFEFFDVSDGIDGIAGFDQENDFFDPSKKLFVTMKRIQVLVKGRLEFDFHCAESSRS